MKDSPLSNGLGNRLDWPSRHLDKDMVNNAMLERVRDGNRKKASAVRVWRIETLVSVRPLPQRMTVPTRNRATSILHSCHDQRSDAISPYYGLLVADDRNSSSNTHTNATPDRGKIQPSKPTSTDRVGTALGISSTRADSALVMKSRVVTRRIPALPYS